ncbi:Ribonuclease H-like superfamily [Sesbania bispinosa]|nr:Ribonuclease H-like superfamily [Sesbania bispinosa]
MTQRSFLCDTAVDKIVWQGSLNGIYSARSGYKWLVEKDYIPLSNQSWSWIWHLAAPENIRFLLWLILHGSLPTMTARRIWDHMGLSSASDFYHTDDMNAWLERNINLYKIPFLAVVWHIWAHTISKVYNKPSTFSQQLRFVCWERPDGTSLALNTDGSYKQNKCGYGGILRSANGQWTNGYFGELGDKDILFGELFAIWKGLTLC